MDLQNFVKETLIQILKGVGEAQHATQPMIARINPSKLRVGRSFVDVSAADMVKQVEFDVAITVEEGKNKEGGGGLKISAFSIDGKKGSKTTNTSASRVKFVVPVVLPFGN